MGCWDESEARKKIEAARIQKLETQKNLQEEAKKTGIGVNGGFNPGSVIEKPGRSSTTIFDARWEEEEQKKRQRPGLKDGFDAIKLSPNKNERQSYKPPDSTKALNVFLRVRSIRGYARQEYGNIHAALAPLYYDAIECKIHTDARVFRVYRDPNQQAQILSNLSKFSRCDTSQGWQQRHDKLSALIDAFENAVFREFEHGIEAGDIEGKLSKYAQVLVSLNGGYKGVELFIARNPVVNEKLRFGRPIACLNEGGPGEISLEQSYNFFSGVSEAFNEQVTIIDQVFPASVNAITPLLQKVGTAVISEYLTTLFDETHGTNVELYLKAVSGTYAQSLSFAKSLRPGRDSGDDFYETVDEIITKAFEPHIDLYLSEEVEVFKRKSDAELGFWERQLSEQDASMQSMFMSNVNRQAEKRDFLKSFKKVVMIPVNVLPVFPISSPFGGKPAVAKALVNGDGLKYPQPSASQPPSRPSTPGISNNPLTINRASTPVLEPPTTELAAKAAIMNSRLEGIRSLFSIEVALNLVHAAKSSIERAAIFFKAGGHFGDDARKQCELVFVLLLQTLGTRHIKAGFDQAVDHLSNYNPREANKHGGSGVVPLVTFLELVNVGDLIQQMLEVFYEQELIATKITDRNDFLDPAVKEKKRFEQMLDERVAAGLNNGIEVLMTEVEYVCATTQKVEDFNPPTLNNSSEVIDIGPSQTAKQVIDIVSLHTKMLIGSTEKNMLDVFNQEVGLRLFTSLCKHLKRQLISVNGAIRLIRYISKPPTSKKPPKSKSLTSPPSLFPSYSDMNHYFTYIQNLRNQDLLQYFAALRELSQIYLIDPSDTKEMATIIADGDRFHGVFRAEEVYGFAERRADWGLMKKGVERAMYGFGCGVM